MLKLKKIISPALCLLLLTAFLGAMSMEFGTAYTSKLRTEVSSSEAHNGLDFQLVSEERDDFNAHYLAVVIPATLLLPGFIFFSPGSALTPGTFSNKQIISKEYLFITLRSLRL